MCNKKVKMVSRILQFRFRNTIEKKKKKKKKTNWSLEFREARAMQPRRISKREHGRNERKSNLKCMEQRIGM